MLCFYLVWKPRTVELQSANPQFSLKIKKEIKNTLNLSHSSTLRKSNMQENIAVTQEKAKEWKTDCLWYVHPVDGRWDTSYRTVNVQLRELQKQRLTGWIKPWQCTPVTPFLIFRAWANIHPNSSKANVGVVNKCTSLDSHPFYKDHVGCCCREGSAVLTCSTCPSLHWPLWVSL